MKIIIDKNTSFASRQILTQKCKNRYSLERHIAPYLTSKVKCGAWQGSGKQRKNRF